MTEQSQSIGGVTTHAALSDVSTPHATADIADSAITSAKIAAGTIVNSDISDTAAIVSSKLAETLIKVVDTTLTSAATQVDITLDLDNVGFYIFLIQLKMAGEAGVNNKLIYFNDDYTNTNYYANTGTGAASNQPCDLWAGDAGENGLFHIILTRGAIDRPIILMRRVYDVDGTDVKTSMYSGTWNSAASVVEMNIKSSNASDIGIGSRFVVLKYV